MIPGEPCRQNTCDLIDRGKLGKRPLSYFHQLLQGDDPEDDPNDSDYCPPANEDDENSEYGPTADRNRDSSEEDNGNDIEDNGADSHQSESDMNWKFTAGPALFSFHQLLNFPEHTAGPDCQHLGGYHGDKITVQEMRDCTTAQCLVRKKQGWRPSNDDSDFERKSAWQLTGLANGNNDSSLCFAPVRNNCNKVFNKYWAILGRPSTHELGAVFHPTCFDLFKIVSRSVLGQIDADGLVELSQSFHGQPHYGRRFCERHPDIYKAMKEEAWAHHAGDEYLSANPIFISGFRDICEAAIMNHKDFSPQQSAFAPRQRSHQRSVSGDTFLKLPSELIQHIVGLLSPKEIAMLRLSSSAFEQLPISLWHQRLIQDFPFIYEAWCDDVQPSKWTYLDPIHLRKVQQEQNEYMREYERKKAIIKQHEPDLLDEWEANEPKCPPLHSSEEYETMAQQRPMEMKKLEPISLPYEKTNWYQLYRDVTLNWKKLKGLRNRARIWDDICQIVDKIKDARKKESEDNWHLDVPQN